MLASATQHSYGCPVCSNSYASTRLCSSCAADPANSEWAEDGHTVSLPSQDAFPSAPHLSDLVSDYHRLRPPTDKQRQILGLLALYGIKIPRRKRVMRDKVLVWITVWHSRALRVREIAWLVGCDEKYVRKVYLQTVQ